MFHLHHGNDFAALAARLTDALAEPPAGTAGDPFRVEIIVTPDNDLARWLSLQIAGRNGLRPHTEFLFPGAFLYEHVFDPMSTALNLTGNADNADTPAFEPQIIRWLIWKLLPELEPTPPFASVREYTRNDSFRRFKLAQKIADLFDRYMTYRPDWLVAWENGKSHSTGKSHFIADDLWQSILWRRLLAETTGTKILHFSAHLERFLREARAAGNRPPAFLHALQRRRRVFYFGVATLPPAHIDVLKALADTGTVEIFFYAINPCEDLWDNVCSEKTRLRSDFLNDLNHPLLGNHGTAGRDFFRLLLDRDLTPETDSFLSEAAGSASAGASGGASGGASSVPFIYERNPATAPSLHTPSLLTALRLAIQRNTPPPAPHERSLIAAGDNSLAVHNCHSPLREIEILRDQLLARFDADASLRPEDVHVLAPDIAAYASHIEAVFGTSRTPFTIAARSLAATSPECRTLLALLDAAAAGRLKATESLALLQHAPIAAHFDISSNEFDELARLLRSANLAWGADAAARAATGAGTVYQNTWRFALDRLLLGTAMSSAGTAPPLPLVPSAATGTAGSVLPEENVRPAQAVLIGKLAAFADALLELADICAAPARLCSEWADILEHKFLGLLDAARPQSAAATDNFVALRSAVAKFQKQTAGTKTDDAPAPFTIVAACLRDALDNAPARPASPVGHIIFTSFGALRNTPARIVAMLGMNDGAFPRTANPPSFDLISNPANPRRTGDSNKRDEDRYAFLTALIAAREQLLIFYTGQNQRDNSPLPPSILVADLLDTLDKYYAAGAVAGTAGKPSELLTITHPLHPFSRRYFTAGKDPRLVSYDAEAFAVAAAATGGGNYELDGSGAGAAGGVVAGAGAAGGAVSLNELANFLISPARTYYNSALGARLEVSEDTLPDDDGPLEPDALLTYSLCCEFLDFLEIHAPTAAAGTAAAGDEHAGTAGTKIFAPLIARLNAAGALPPAPKKLLDAAASCALALAGAVNALATGPRRPAFTRDLKLPAGTLQITFSEIRENGTQLFFRPSSSVKGKDRVRDTLWHLARCALGETTQTIRLAGNKKIEKLTYEPVASELAREHLNRLLVRYLAVTAGNPPPCFQPDAALIALETPPEGLNDALPKIRAAWNGRTEKGVQIGGADTYARRKFGSDPFEDTTGTPLADLLAIANETIAIAQPTFM